MHDRSTTTAGPAGPQTSHSFAPPNPYARGEVAGRALPFLVAIILGLALLPLQDAPVNWTLLAVSLLGLGLLALAMLNVWRLDPVPAWVRGAMPLAYLLSIALLREATGGTLSGYGPLLFLAPFWVALYDTRAQVLWASFAMFCVHAGHGQIEAEFEDVTALRWALLSGIVIGLVSLAIERNVSRLRRAEERIAHESAERALANERLAENVEQLRHLDQLKSRFVAIASHELRTPLASISGFSNTLSVRWDDIPDADRRHFVEIIDEQSDRLSRLVDDLLVLSKIESGAVSGRPETVELGKAVQALLEGLDVTLQEFQVKIHPDTVVMADRDHLQQMLLNYVSNAIKYGESPICVEATQDGEFTDVVVTDSGPGVPEDLQPILFEEFARAQHHVDRGISGTGLGLSIVRGLARAQGGDAWHEPNHPTGSRFMLRLPSVAQSHGQADDLTSSVA